MRDNLRAPPITTVIKWGKQLGMTRQASESVSDALGLRHQLARDPGILSNTKSYKKITPKSHASPYFAQGDLGKREKIGRKNSDYH